MEFAALTDVGRHRKNNEDNYFIYHNEMLAGGMVADGMGGENSGEIASKMAVDIIKHHIICNFDPSMDYMQIAEIIREAYLVANREIYKQSQKQENEGMGTTATLAIVYDNKLIIAHVGDSRCYCVDDNGINQLTTDHSYVGELLRSGKISENDAMYHPNKNMITRALGAEPMIKIDMNITSYNNQTILLCSDGLTNMISDEQIYDILKQSITLDSAIDKMIELANKKGGNDNITAIVFKNSKGENE